MGEIQNIRENSKKAIKSGASASNYYRTYDASPIYTFQNASLATNEEWLIDIAEDKPDARKFLPLTNVQFTNNSSSDVYIYINQNRNNAKIIPAGVSITFDRSVIPAINSLIVKNVGTAMTASTFEVSIWKQGVVVDEAFRQLHKAFYTKVFGWRG